MNELNIGIVALRGSTFFAKLVNFQNYIIISKSIKIIFVDQKFKKKIIPVHIIHLYYLFVRIQSTLK